MATQRGTYKVDGNEPKRNKNVIPCIVHFLDDTEKCFDLPKQATGEELLTRVFEHLDVIETDYFGLIFEDFNNLKQWLQKDKKVKNQLKKGINPIFYFRVKFYIPQPGDLQEEVTRYQFFLQVKQDLIQGRLDPSQNTMVTLGAYAIQAECGDYDPSLHIEGYVSEYRVVPDQTEELERRVAEQHKTLIGMTPADCELEYLRRAQRMSMYGVELHTAQEADGTNLQIGVGHEGVTVYYDAKTKANTFPWAIMRKMTFKRKKFFLFLRAREDTHGLPESVGFRMINYPAAKKLWKACIEHHTFFRKIDYKPARRSTIRLGSSFRYSGRTLHQTREFGRQSVRYNYSVKRTPSKRFQRRTKDSGASGRFHVAERSHREAAQGVPVKPATAIITAENIKSNDPDLRSNPKNEMDSGKQLELQTEDHDLPPPPDILLESPKQPTENYFKTDDAVFDEFPEGTVSDDGLVTIRMEPDPQSRFGFNVKGGSDQGIAIKVSRVIEGGPASIARPRLHNDDLVIEINGENVTQWTHEQVVVAIKQTRELRPPILVLRVRPSVPIPRRPVTEARAVEMVNEMRRVSTSVLPPSARPQDFLKLSMDQLHEGLKNGVALQQFDQLFRRKENMTMLDAIQTDNFCRNRYRDIAPYDQTRVKLKEGNDYINASHVKMEFRGGNLDYIAAQGPLPHTVDDYWQMIWEQHCSMLIMATVENEAGRPKCHRYWPEEKSTKNFWKLEVTMQSESVDPKLGTVRKLLVKNTATNEVRNVTQFQYVDWPDHGEPEDMAVFINFVLSVNKLRKPNEPLLVHCSAGVGRTGMFIVMETGLVMMQREEPVYPLDLVRLVRNQRPMVIQTSAQYGFICEALLHAFDSKLYLNSVSSDYPDGGPGVEVIDPNKDIRDVLDGRKRRMTSESSSSSSSDSDSDSSDSDSSSDGDVPRQGGEDAAHIRLNPLAMDD